jgi:hypothetical protein
MRLAVGIVAIIGLMCNACSIYPLPQDYSGSLTRDIVENIRCEARNGLRSVVLDYLEGKFADYVIWRRMKGRELAPYLRRNPEKWLEIKIKDLDKSIKGEFEFYENSQIAYEFSLDMEESNTDTADLGFLRTFASRKDNLGLSAESARIRHVTRTFNVVDTFSELALQVGDNYCLRQKSINIVYPIAGKLPVKDLVENYIYINNFGNLGGPGTTQKDIFGTTSTPAIPQMGDTIVFTTKLSCSVNPTFTLGPTGPGFLLASAGFKTADYRQDKHQVIIVVSTSPDAAKAHPLDPTKAPPLPADRQLFAAQSRFYYLPPAQNGKLTDQRASYAIGTLAAQRQRNVDDAIIQIGSSLSQLTH